MTSLQISGKEAIVAFHTEGSSRPLSRFIASSLVLIWMTSIVLPLQYSWLASSSLLPPSTRLHAGCYGHALHFHSWGHLSSLLTVLFKPNLQRPLCFPNVGLSAVFSMALHTHALFSSLVRMSSLSWGAALVSSLAWRLFWSMPSALQTCSSFSLRPQMYEVQSLVTGEFAYLGTYMGHCGSSSH